MSNTRFKIVFDGALLPGVEIATAQLNLAQLFKTDVQAVEKLFTGRPVALKRELSQVDAQKYLEALRNAGIDARVEAEPSLELNLDEVHETSSPHAAPAFTAQPASPYAPPQALVGESFGEYGPLNVFSFSGRIGRVRYLAWTLVLTVAMLVLIGGATIIGVLGALFAEGFTLATVFGLLVLIAVVVVSVFVSMQITVQRLHDLGWSGWLWLLNFVPIVNSFFPLVLMVSPGSNIPNQYGPPPPPNSKGVKVLAWMWVVLIVVLIVGGIVAGINAVQNESVSEVSYSETEPAVEAASAVDEAQDGAETDDPSVDSEEE